MLNALIHDLVVSGKANPTIWGLYIRVAEPSLMEESASLVSSATHLFLSCPVDCHMWTHTAQFLGALLISQSVAERQRCWGNLAELMP